MTPSPRHVSVAERRAALVTRHHLAGDAADPAAVVRGLVALHATDPASVYASVLARSAESSLANVAAALYERRELVRWMAMRRTLFVFARADVPMIQAAVSAPLALTLRRRLIARLERTGTEPPIDSELGPWLDALETRVDAALARRGAATGSELADDEPALRTRLLPGTPSQRPESLTSTLLTLMSAEGRLVRAVPTGPWTSRHHRWEPVGRWWPDGLEAIDPERARRDLARRWLERFGPATADDLRWWTGWNQTTTRGALAGLRLEEVDLHGAPGIALAGDAAPPGAGRPADNAPVAALLPALDPTPMGWTHRAWFLPSDPSGLFDRAGNIGPTIWWDGEIVGGWATAAGGEIRTALLADRGDDARRAIDHAAAGLQARLQDTVIVPAARTPLERSLTER